MKENKFVESKNVINVQEKKSAYGRHLQGYNYTRFSAETDQYH
jgi:hypothetical protein